MKYRYLIIFLYFWLQNEKQYTHFYMNLVIYLFIFPTPPLTSGYWKPPKITSFSKFSFLISLFGEKFWVKKKSIGGCNGCVMAIWIFACYESGHSLVLVWWVLLWDRFYVNSTMWEGEVNICSGATTHHTEASLVMSIWKGLGVCPYQWFSFFLVVNSCNLWKMFWKNNPPNLFIF